MTEELIDVPDSADVRLARLDESLKNAMNRLEAMSEAYAPTNKTVIENALKISELQADLHEIRSEMVRQVERRETKFREVEGQVLAVGHAVSDLERKWEKQRAAFERSIENLDVKWERERVAQERRDREVHAALEQKARDDRRTRNRWIIGLAAALLTALASVYMGTVLG